MKFLPHLFCAVLFCFGGSGVYAQWESVRQEGEIGFSVGAAHYFGDLNTESRINRPKPAIGAFYRKQFANYIGVRFSALFAQLGYSDVYNVSNTFQQRRNLSFNSNVFELSLLGDFNFFKFVPGDKYHAFTPYVTFGVGIFSFDPYAFLKYNGTTGKYFLRPLGTEGQGDPNYPDRKPYSPVAFCFPLGVGVKYALNDRMNIGAEIIHRFTDTDYLDDVSKSYVDPSVFLKSGSITPAYLLQDRSYETGDPRIGFPADYAPYQLGIQRGFEKQKDQYITASLTLSFNITSYRCPKAD